MNFIRKFDGNGNENGQRWERELLHEMGDNEGDKTYSCSRSY